MNCDAILSENPYKMALLSVQSHCLHAFYRIHGVTLRPLLMAGPSMRFGSCGRHATHLAFLGARISPVVSRRPANRS